MRYLFVVLILSFFSLSLYAEPAQLINEYKIEQLQKSIDTINSEIKELKKDIDDTKEKKIENKKDNESLDKRIGDINYNITAFGIFITVLLLGFGFFGYRNAKADAKKEAENTTKAWIEKEGETKLKEIIEDLQKQSEKQFSNLVDEKTNEFNALQKAFEEKHNEQLNIHEKEFKQLKETYTPQEQTEIETKAKESQEKTTKTFDDYWNIFLGYYNEKDYKQALDNNQEALKLPNLTILQKGRLYFASGYLYKELKEYDNAKTYYLKAIEAGNTDALNNLVYLYFTLAKEPKEALSLVQKSYNTDKDYENTHTLATILLWNEEFAQSYEKFDEWLQYDEALKDIDGLSEYLNLLIAKGQYYKAKEYFDNETYQLKDRVKPICYALMTLMQDEFPDEIKMIESELQESVDDTLVAIKELEQKYKKGEQAIKEQS